MYGVGGSGREGGRGTATVAFVGRKGVGGSGVVRLGAVRCRVVTMDVESYEGR